MKEKSNLISLQPSPPTQPYNSPSLYVMLLPLSVFMWKTTFLFYVFDQLLFYLKFYKLFVYSWIMGKSWITLKILATLPFKKITIKAFTGQFGLYSIRVLENIEDIVFLFFLHSSSVNWLVGLALETLTNLIELDSLPDLLYHVSTEALHVVGHPAKLLPPPALVIHQFFYSPSGQDQWEVCTYCCNVASTYQLQTAELQHQQAF